MNEIERDPLTEDQLSRLLAKWTVAAPADLEQRVTAAAGLAGSRERRNWWRFFLKGSIRVPIPLACCMAVLMIALVWHSATVAVTCAGASAAMEAKSSTTVSVQSSSTHVVCPANSKC